MTDWIGFAAAVLLIELTPGPNMAWLVALTLGEGRRAGISAVIGVAVGLAINGAVAAIGLTTVLREAPWILVLLRYAGFVTLLILALLTWRSRPSVQPEHSGRNGATTGDFTAGLILNLFNPKALLFFMVVAPRFLADGARLSEALVLVAISVIIATTIHTCLVLLAGRASGWLRHDDRIRYVRRFLALAIIGIAIWTIV